MDASAHQKALGAPPQMTPEDMILHAATHMQAAGHDFSVNAAMSAHMGHHNPFQQHDNISRHPLPEQQFGPNASFTEGDSQMLDREDNEEGDPMAALVGAPKPTGSKSSANNELEMRQLFGANRHRSLQDVASELHGNERGPNSERARQVFAMLW
jgi:regulatory factor X